MCQAKKVIYTLTSQTSNIRVNRKDLFLKIAGRRYVPRLCRGFRRRLILVPYAAIQDPAPSPPEKRASSDITTAMSAVLPGRSRRSKTHRRRTRSLFRQHSRAWFLFQPRNTSESCPFSTALPRPNQRSKVNRRQRIKNKKRRIARNSRKPSRRRLHRQLSKTFFG